MVAALALAPPVLVMAALAVLVLQLVTVPTVAAASVTVALDRVTVVQLLVQADLAAVVVLALVVVPPPAELAATVHPIVRLAVAAVVATPEVVVQMVP